MKAFWEPAPFSSIRQAFRQVAEKIAQSAKAAPQSFPRTSPDAFTAQALWFARTTDKYGYPKVDDEPEAYPVQIIHLAYDYSDLPSDATAQSDGFPQSISAAELTAVDDYPVDVIMARVPPSRVANIPVAQGLLFAWRSARAWLPPDSLVVIARIAGDWWIVGALDHRVHTIFGTLYRCTAEQWLLKSPQPGSPLFDTEIDGLEDCEVLCPEESAGEATTTSGPTTTVRPCGNPTSTTSTTSTTGEPSSTTTSTTTTPPACVPVINPLRLSLKPGCYAAAVLNSKREWVITQIEAGCSGSAAKSQSSVVSPPRPTTPPGTISVTTTPPGTCDSATCDIQCENGTLTVACSDCPTGCYCTGEEQECNPGDSWSGTFTCAPTTSEGSCSGSCGFTWDGSKWTIEEGCRGEGCRCCYPEFCGSAQSTYTRTACEYDPDNLKVCDTFFPEDTNCTTTTTTTTPQPTTTAECSGCGPFPVGHPCCPPTTTSPKAYPPCNGCVYKAVVTASGFAWKLVENTCYDATGNPDCGVCQKPQQAPANICDSALMSCVPRPTTTVQRYPAECPGGCDYMWSATDYAWYLISATCPYGSCPGRYTCVYRDVCNNARSLDVLACCGCEAPAVVNCALSSAVFSCVNGAWVQTSHCWSQYCTDPSPPAGPCVTGQVKRVQCTQVANPFPCGAIETVPCKMYVSCPECTKVS